MWKKIFSYNVALCKKCNVCPPIHGHGGRQAVTSPDVTAKVDGENTNSLTCLCFYFRISLCYFVDIFLAFLLLIIYLKDVKNNKSYNLEYNGKWEKMNPWIFGKLISKLKYKMLHERHPQKGKDMQFCF